ncbi:MAG TPA: ATP-binding protein [Gemmatimonadaceae bacterium]|nr:ATP-binding protein [Gemmatimonadaceae bacterium]
MKRDSVTGPWLLWGGLLALVTIALVSMREVSEQTYVPLTYLLIVLGGSASGGRKLGFALACASFLIIDYYLQTPYDRLSFGKSIDFVTLAAFLVTAGAASELLARARRDRDEAVRRADEVTALSRLGSESLAAARAADAVAAVAAMVRIALGAEECTLTPGELPGADGSEPDAGVLVVPLYVHERRVGTLMLRHREPMSFRAGQRIFLDALSYYAALALERARLADEAEKIAGLREADRMKDFVLASVSHDLRTPLTTIKALAQDEQRTGTQHGAEVEEQADRLTRMVADLLDLSRLRAGSFVVTPELNAAEDVVGAAIRQCATLADGRRMVATLDETAPALYGTFDFVQTLRVLVNLLENALRFAPPGSDVELAARREDGELVLTVSDRGPGIARQERDRVFDPFYRPQGSLADRGRAGLGLAIARTIAEAQGGSLVHREREGGGSVFEVRLHAADVDQAALGES